jgi:hypothetical protein
MGCDDVKTKRWRRPRKTVGRFWNIHAGDNDGAAPE